MSFDAVAFSLSMDNTAQLAATVSSFLFSRLFFFCCFEEILIKFSTECNSQLLPSPPCDGRRIKTSDEYCAYLSADILHVGVVEVA